MLSRFPVEGERCIVRDWLLFKRFEVNETVKKPASERIGNTLTGLKDYPESQGQNLALTASNVASSLDSGYKGMGVVINDTIGSSHQQ